MKKKCMWFLCYYSFAFNQLWSCTARSPSWLWRAGGLAKGVPLIIVMVHFFYDHHFITSLSFQLNVKLYLEEIQVGLCEGEADGDLRLRVGASEEGPVRAHRQRRAQEQEGYCHENETNLHLFMSLPLTVRGWWFNKKQNNSAKPWTYSCVSSPFDWLFLSVEISSEFSR